MCGLGMLVGFFGIMMTFGQITLMKFHDLNRNYMIDKDDAILKKEFHDAICIHIEIKELSVY